MRISLFQNMTRLYVHAVDLAFEALHHQLVQSSVGHTLVRRQWKHGTSFRVSVQYAQINSFVKVLTIVVTPNVTQAKSIVNTTVQIYIFAHSDHRVVIARTRDAHRLRCRNFP